MSEDRTLFWGTEGEHNYASGEGGSGPPDGNFVVAETDTGTRLFEWDGTQWISRGAVNMDGNDIEGVGSLTTEGLNNIVTIKPGDDVQDRVDEAGEDGAVWFSPGSYTIESIDVHDGQTLIGHRESTHITYTDGSCFDASDRERVHICSFKLEADGGSSCVNFDGASACRASDISGISSGNDVIRITDSSEIEVWNIYGEDFSDDCVDVTNSNDIKIRNVEGYDSQRQGTSSAGGAVEIDDGSHNVQVSNVYGENVVVAFEIHSSQGDALPSDVIATNIKGVDCTDSAVRVTDTFDVEDGSESVGITISGVNAIRCRHAVRVNIGRDDPSESTLKNLVITDVNGSEFKGGMYGVDVWVQYSIGEIENFVVDDVVLDGSGTTEGEKGIRIRGHPDINISHGTVSAVVSGFDQRGALIRELTGVNVDVHVEGTQSNHGVEARGLTSCRVRGRSSDNDGLGVWVRECEDTVFDNFDAERNNGAGIQFSFNASEGCEVIGGIFAENDGENIRMSDDQLTEGRIEGAKVRSGGVTGVGIQIESGNEDIIAIHNDLRDAGTSEDFEDNGSGTITDPVNNDDTDDYNIY